MQQDKYDCVQGKWGPLEQEFKEIQRLCHIALPPDSLAKKKKGFYWRNYLLLNWSVQLQDHLIASFTAIQEYVSQYNLSEFGALKNKI